MYRSGPQGGTFFEVLIRTSEVYRGTLRPHSKFTLRSVAQFTISTMRIIGNLNSWATLGSLSASAFASTVPIGERNGGYLAPYHKATGSLPRPDEYFVIFHGVSYDYKQHFRTIGRDFENNNATRFKWHDIGNTYYVSNLTSDCIERIRRDPAVEAVEEAETWEMLPVEVSDTRLDLPEEVKSQGSRFTARSDGVWFPDDTPAAPWHLQALSAVGKLNNIPTFGHATQLKYNDTVGGGQGVNIYVLDSGMNISHEYFEGRARNFGRAYACEDGDCYADFIGHGTAVAGLAAARYVGAAQGANIVNVKTFYRSWNRTPRTDPEYILEALKAIAKEHKSYLENPPPGWKGSVINMSIGGDMYRSSHIVKAINRLYYLGVHVVAAAGNRHPDGESADDIWPCNMNTICVGGTNDKYEQDWYSNRGGNVTMFAPGTDVRTLHREGGTTKQRGTSFAAPLVAGIIAIFTGWEDLGFAGTNEPNTARARLSANMLTDIVSNPENEDKSDLGGPENNFVNTGINNADKLGYEPYKGVGEFLIPSLTLITAHTNCPQLKELLLSRATPLL